MRVARFVLLAIAALAPASCSIPGAQIHNLEVLHDSDGRHKYSAPVMGNVEYAMRVGVMGAFKGVGASIETKEPVAIPDPANTCLENLVDLSDHDPKDVDVAAAQVEFDARLCLLDPWTLTRERGTLELGPAGQRLGLAVDPWKPREGPKATVEDVRMALTVLVRSINPKTESEFDDPGVAKVPVPQACKDVLALNYDLEGAVRVLRAVRVIASKLGAGKERDEVRDLSIQLQRECAAQALELARSDKNPIVRAASVRAVAQAYGDKGVSEALDVLAGKDVDPLVLVAVFDVLRKEGLPPPPADLPELERGAWRDAQLLRLYRYATLHPDGRVRIGAMLALSAVSDSGIHSLQEEVWQTWWLETHPAAEATPKPPETPAAPTVEAKP